MGSNVPRCAWRRPGRRRVPACRSREQIAGRYNRALPSMNDSEAPLAQYVFRPSVLEGPRRHVLYRDRIAVEDEGHAPRGDLLSEVEGVRLKYERTKQRADYQCSSRTGRGTIALQHLSWKGFGDFEDRRDAYTPFVRALLTQLASQPNVQFRAGSPANFIPALAGVPLMANLG